MEANQNSFLKKWTRAWIIATFLLVISFGMVALIAEGESNSKWIISTLLVLFLVLFTRWAYQYWNRKFIIHGVLEERNKNPYRKMFFNGVNTLSIILLTVGIVGAIVLLVEEKSDIYGALGLIIIVIWMVIFLRYFIWAVYFYNINYGLTDKDWERIFKAREDKRLGLDVHESETKGPTSNPYKDETFGLPQGTVRGMIAFTLLFGAISMLVISMSKDGEISENTFFWDHFEFFKTAFLMMIAFYFGDKSLKYLQKRWPSAQQAARFKAKNEDTEPGSGENETDSETEEEEDDSSTETLANDVSPTRIKNGLAGSKVEAKDKLEKEFVHIADNKASKFLTSEAIKAIAEKENIEPAALQAIIKVEAAGKGFLNSGKPKILFEGHKFWKHLETRKIEPSKHLSGNEDILYKKWTKKYYKGGEGEYSRFYKAKNIDAVAAVYSTSWGLFQILGENFECKYGVCKKRVKDFNDYEEFVEKKEKLIDAIDKEINEVKRAELINEKEKLEFEYEYQFYKYDSNRDLDVDDFIDKISESEGLHLMDFMEFIKNKKVIKHNGFTGSLYKILTDGKKNQKYNWDAFAYGYNGAAYKTHNYQYKLQKAYESYK